MRVYREFLIDENSRAVEVRCIDESTGSEIAELSSVEQPLSRHLDWTLLTRPSLDLAVMGRAGDISRP